MTPSSVTVDMPGGETRAFTDLVLDYTGTLSRDGLLLPGVAERLTALAACLRITVLTADTFGMALAQLAGLPVEVSFIRTGRDKADAVRSIGSDATIAIGNGRNDVPLMQAAGLAIAVIGPEGVAGELLAESDVIVRDINDALDLVSNPLRLKATLRD